MSSVNAKKPRWQESRERGWRPTREGQENETKGRKSRSHRTEGVLAGEQLSAHAAGETSAANTRPWIPIEFAETATARPFQVPRAGNDPLQVQQVFKLQVQPKSVPSYGRQPRLEEGAHRPS